MLGWPDLTRIVYQFCLNEVSKNTRHFLVSDSIVSNNLIQVSCTKPENVLYSMIVPFSNIFHIVIFLYLLFAAASLLYISLSFLLEQFNVRLIFTQK